MRVVNHCGFLFRFNNISHLGEQCSPRVTTLINIILDNKNNSSKNH